MVFNDHDIETIMHQQDALTAAIARNRRRAVLENKIQRLMAERDNIQSEEPRGKEACKRRRLH